MKRIFITDFKVSCYMYNTFKNLILPVQKSKLCAYIQYTQICTHKVFYIMCREKILVIFCHQVNSLIFQGNKHLCGEGEGRDHCHKHRHMCTSTHLRCPAKAELESHAWHFTTSQQSPVHWAGLGWAILSVSIGLYRFILSVSIGYRFSLCFQENKVLVKKVQSSPEGMG